MQDSKGKFVKGSIPWNKGKKGLNLGGESGWFKTGRKLSPEIEERRLTNLREKTLLKPKLEMNRNLAYIIGVLKGDGYTTRNGRAYQICLSVTNKIFADSFHLALKSIGLNPFIQKVKPYNGISKQIQFRVIANSKIFYQWYLGIQNLDEILTTKEAISGFVKGFYESEGTIYRNIDRTVIISISNTDLEILKTIQSILKRLDIDFNINGPYENNHLSANSKPIYRLQSGAKKNVQKFLRTIKPSIKSFY